MKKRLQQFLIPVALFRVKSIHSCKFHAWRIDEVCGCRREYVSQIFVTWRHIGSLGMRMESGKDTISRVTEMAYDLFSDFHLICGVQYSGDRLSCI